MERSPNSVQVTGADHETDVEVLDLDPAALRRPMDLVQALVCAIGSGIVLLLALGARGTAAGAAADIARSVDQIPGVLMALVGLLATLPLLGLPVVLVVVHLARREGRRVSAAVAAALLGALIAALANRLLIDRVDPHLLATLAPLNASGGPSGPLTVTLTAVVAFATALRLSGRPVWLQLVIAAVILDCLYVLGLHLAAALGLALTLLVGRMVGLLTRYGLGSYSAHPDGRAVARAMADAGLPLRRIARDASAASPFRVYGAVTTTGRSLDVHVIDRDAVGAGVLYSLYRAVRVRKDLTRTESPSLERTVERICLMAYALHAAGVRTPQPLTVMPLGSDTVAIATNPVHGVPLAAANGGGVEGGGVGGGSLDGAGVGGSADPPLLVTDDDLAALWASVERLHGHRVAHRSLLPHLMLLERDGEPVLLQPERGIVAAGDLRLQLDKVQLLVSTAQVVGPDRAHAAALAALGADRLLSLAPLLQPVALHRDTRAELRRHKDLLEQLHQRLQTLSGSRPPAPARLERVRPRTLLLLTGTVIGAYLLYAQLGSVNLLEVLRSADYRWVVPGLGLTIVTYLGAAYALRGLVPGRINLWRTLQAQVAGAFATFVAPPAVGAAALNLRFLQASGIALPIGVASVGLNQVVAFLVHVLLLLIVLVAAGRSTDKVIDIPSWAGVVLLVIGVLVGIGSLIPPLRRRVVAQVRPTAVRVARQLAGLATNPRAVAEGIGGAVLLNAGYVGALATSVHAFGGRIDLVAVAIVYLTVSAVGSAAPTPGGLGVIEAALTAGLVAAGMPGGAAVSAVLLYRILTFWLPVPVGWWALLRLQKLQLV